MGSRLMWAGRGRGWRKEVFASMGSGRTDGRLLICLFERKSVTRVEEGRERNCIP